MPGPTLETMNRRRLRSAAARRRQRQAALIGAACALAVVVLAAGAWAFVSANGKRTADAREATGPGIAEQTTTAPAGTPGGASASGTASASDAGTTGPAASATPATGSAEPSAAAAAGPATITVAAVGDMIFDRRVKSLISERGGEAPLARVAKRLRKADITIGNLESPLSKRGTMDADKDVTFRGDPRAIEGLSAAGFDVVSIANNHMLDYGPKALSDTVRALDEAGIAHAGAGKNQKAAWKPGIVETGDDTTAYLAFTFVVPAGFVAQSDRAGIASGRWDVGLIEDAIKKAKRTHDYVIVSFHWGVEYKDDANAEQIKVAHRAVKAGADMVLAHHPHVIQGVEIYRKKLIAYSLGDFVFDHYSRKTGESFILNAKMGPAGVTDIKVTPTYLDTYGRPAVVRGAEAKAILKRLKTISKAHGTKVVIDGDTATVTR